jgi:hypothetical protein
MPFYLSPVNEIELINVADRGVANQERIIMRVGWLPVQIAQFSVILGYQPFEAAEPMRDSFLWLGEAWLDARTWIFVYTGPGDTAYSKRIGTEEPAYVVHWNRPVLFSDPNVVPILVKLTEATIGRRPGRQLELPSVPSGRKT